MCKFIIAFREKYFIYFDTFGVLFLIVVIASISRIFQFNLPLPLGEGVEYGSLYLEIASIYAGLLGFMIAIGSIVFSIDSGKRIEALRKNPNFSQILDTYISASRWLAIGAFAMIVIYIYTDHKNPNEFTKYIFLGSLIIAAVKGWRAVTILKKIFSLSAKSKGD